MMKWFAAAAVVVAIGAGVFAWQRHEAAEAAAAQVAGLKAEAQKADADMKAARAERDALRKEMAELKLAADQMRAEIDTAKQFIEAERAVSARLREDLAMAAARLAMMASRPQQRSADAIPPGVLPPGMMLMPRDKPPVAVRLAPNAGPTAVGVARPAQ
jgi:hypothetical protein